MFRLTALGGTFDIIHIGHIGLIGKAVSISEKIIIGLTSDEFISKHGKKINNNFEQRFENLEKMIHENFPNCSFEIAKLDDDLCFGTIDSWLIYKFTGNHVTDVTNASRTLLMDLNSLTWLDSVIKILDIPKYALPTIKPSLFSYGTNKKILKNVPITAVLGDQQASLFGHNCISTGDVKNTYGTGCFALTNTGSEIVNSNNGLLSTVAYQQEGSKPQYALEGSVSIAGAAVQWLRDNLNIIKDSSEVESLAMSVKDNGDVYFVPAFSGLFSRKSGFQSILINWDLNLSLLISEKSLTFLKVADYFYSSIMYSRSYSSSKKIHLVLIRIFANAFPQMIYNLSFSSKAEWQRSLTCHLIGAH